MDAADRILVIAPHPDDCELGCGASLARHAAGGSKVLVLMLSDRGEPDWLKEATAAASCLHESIKVETLHLTPFHMANERQSLMRSMEEYRERFKPQCVLCPAEGDEHQDHLAALLECRRVFKGCTLLGYELLRSNKRFRPRMYVKVTWPHVHAKCEAVSQYSTQRDKYYCFPTVIRAQAMVHGAACEVEFAEAFDVEWMVL